jgi:hypothetical protein
MRRWFSAFSNIRKERDMNKLVVIGGCVALIVLLQSGFIFFLLAMLPAIMAFYTDMRPDKSVFKILGACNLAAAMSSLVPMVQTTLKFKHYDVTTVMFDPAAWLLVYTGAAMGWGLIYLCRFIARFALIMSYEYHVMALNNEQKHLLEEWGKEIEYPPMPA